VDLFYIVVKQNLYNFLHINYMYILYACTDDPTSTETLYYVLKFSQTSPNVLYLT